MDHKAAKWIVGFGITVPLLMVIGCGEARSPVAVAPTEPASPSKSVDDGGAHASPPAISEAAVDGGSANEKPSGRASPVVQAPSLRRGVLKVNGRLPPEVIDRIVRQNFGRFRLCWEQGLVRDPGLGGTVSTTFVIQPDGRVTGPKSDGSDLGDTTVVDCVVRNFANLSFPAPEGGTVTVVYPLIFNPGDGAVKKTTF